MILSYFKNYGLTPCFKKYENSLNTIFKGLNAHISEFLHIIFSDKIWLWISLKNVSKNAGKFIVPKNRLLLNSERFSPIRPIKGWGKFFSVHKSLIFLQKVNFFLFSIPKSMLYLSACDAHVVIPHFFCEIWKGGQFNFCLICFKFLWYDTDN